MYYTFLITCHLFLTRLLNVFLWTLNLRHCQTGDVFQEYYIAGVTAEMVHGTVRAYTHEDCRIPMELLQELISQIMLIIYGRKWMNLMIFCPKWNPFTPSWLASLNIYHNASSSRKTPFWVCRAEFRCYHSSINLFIDSPDYYPYWFNSSLIIQCLKQLNFTENFLNLSFVKERERKYQWFRCYDMLELGILHWFSRETNWMTTWYLSHVNWVQVKNVIVLSHT